MISQKIRMTKNTDIFSRVVKKYKIICAILLLLLLIQIFLAIRVALIHSESQSSRNLGESSSAIHKIGHSDNNGNNVRSTANYFFDAFSLFRNQDQEEKDDKLQEQDSEQLDEKDSMEHLKSEITLNSLQLNQSSSSPQSSLNLESLGFVPECQITSKEAISAIQRAKTLECKQELVRISCAASLYPIRLSRLCKVDGNTYMKYIGCYQDEQKNRILPDHFALLKISNSPQNCADLCLQSGFSFAGVQYSIECFCGNKRPSNDLIIPSSECNMKCPATDNNKRNESICGGYFTVNVYETGISDLTGQEVKGLDDIRLKLLENTISAEEKVGIVFFLTLNGRAVRQVIRLIKTLFRKQHYFYIHVDARQDYLFRELQVLNEKIPNNIRFMQNREASIWGGASLLTTLLNGMEDLVNNSKDWRWKWDYVINLSESDFPLKTIEQLEMFLTLNNGKNFVKSHGRDVQKFITRQGLDKTFVECENRMWRIGSRKLPAGLFLDGGSDWIALHNDFVNYVVSSGDELVSGLRVVFKQTLLPAETFFHTVLRNSPFCGTFVDNNLHVTNWKRKLGCKCQYRHIVDWCGCSPNDFRLADWNRLESTESRLIFFGRKFESVVNQAIVNKLELKLHPGHHDYRHETLDKYWHNIYHHRDKSPQPKDAILTLGQSLGRMGAKAFVQKFMKHRHSKTFQFLEDDFEINVEEITAFTQYDRMEGILVKFEAHIIDELSIKLECWFKLQPGLVHYEEDSSILDKFADRFQNLRIGEDYDQKEQIFRNYAGILGPNSEPTIAYSAFTDEPFNVSFVWISPQNKVKNIMNASIGIGETANYVKPSLKAPLMTGNWKVNLQGANKVVIASTQFLITPLEFQNGKRVSSEDESGHENIQELQTLIDSLMSSYYQVEDICLVKPISQVLFATLNQSNNKNIHQYKFIESASKSQHNANAPTVEANICSETPWSSLYPDPKGTVESIDEKTGLLLP